VWLTIEGPGHAAKETQLDLAPGESSLEFTVALQVLAAGER
jgi:hypothetical protein